MRGVSDLRDGNDATRGGTSGSDAAEGASGSDSDDAGTAVGQSNARHDRITSTPTPGPRNSLQHWTEVRNPLRMMVNFLVILVVRYSPSLRLKSWLLRRLGADVGSGVSLALAATPDVFWPELITIEDDAIVGYDVTILCHEFLQDEYRTGEVVVGERVMIGAGATILPGVEIGADARVAANSLVASDVPPGTTVAGVPASPVEDADEDGDGKEAPPDR